nr:hypothetical protein Iba_chr13eCG9570 [Ipomoea batatas]
MSWISLYHIPTYSPPELPPRLKNPSWKTPPAETNVWFCARGCVGVMVSTAMVNLGMRIWRIRKYQNKNLPDSMAALIKEWMLCHFPATCNSVWLPEEFDFDLLLQPSLKKMASAINMLLQQLITNGDMPVWGIGTHGSLDASTTSEFSCFSLLCLLNSSVFISQQAFKSSSFRALFILSISSPKAEVHSACGDLNVSGFSG